MLKKYAAGIFALALLAFSCDDDRTLTTLRLGSAPVIESPSDGSTYVLTEDNLAEEFATFTWTAADFGYKAGIDYYVEMVAAGGDFGEAIDVSPLVNDTKVSVTNDRMNQLLLSNAFIGGIPNEVDVRVRAVVSDKVDQLVSAPITLTITPVAVEIDYPKLNVPGSYQGWDPENDATVIFSVAQNNLYEGYLFISEANAAYKFALGNWDTNWGDDDGDGTLDPGGADIPLGDAGLHKFNADLETLSYSAVLTNWGLIGDATGSWDVDQDLTYDPETGLLSVTLDLVPGEIKFRANDDWDINLGDDNVILPGLDYGGANIPVADAGNYTVRLDLTKAVYTYTVTKN